MADMFLINTLVGLYCSSSKDIFEKADHCRSQEEVCLREKVCLKAEDCSKVEDREKQ